LKAYWPEVSRIREGDIIGMAMNIGENNRHVAKHLPGVICSHGFIKHSIGIIREYLSIATKCDRVFRVKNLSPTSSVIGYIHPIAELVGERFWKAFWECFRCKCRSQSPFISEHLLVLGHCYLWEGGIKHNDISVGNLMNDKMNDDAGVLNDFDLANVGE
jgi:hypothetical protein